MVAEEMGPNELAETETRRQSTTDFCICVAFPFGIKNESRFLPLFNTGFLQHSK